MTGTNCYLGIVDTSGFEIYYTKQLRENDIGVLSLGHLVFPSMMIPERQSHWNITGYCPQECTDRVCQIFFHLITDLSVCEMYL